MRSSHGLLLFIIFTLSLLPTTVATQTHSSVIATIQAPPIGFKEDTELIRLDLQAFSIEFYKGSKGYNILYDESGSALVYDERVNIEYWTGNKWKQRGTPVDVSTEKLTDHHYIVTRSYTDYIDTTYTITYDVTPEKVKWTLVLRSGQTDTYRVVWVPSGITDTSYEPRTNKIEFESLIFDWSDVYATFGDITSSSISTSAQGRKAEIIFNVGEVLAGQELVLDPSTVASST